ncbi:PQQ-binding-like beta-propeller repeat protein [Rosistilla oblonga]|uniref:outer membrane protein assembly factor BamB family protein n=1 Tax=Rosistilla oblonga TaxID=2527990 RepID=UPI003A96FA71
MNTLPFCRSLGVVATLLLTTQIVAAVEWSQFRGTAGDGIADVTHAPTQWSETENVVWKTPIAGKGWSSPVVADGKVWMTTAIEEQATEEERIATLERLVENPRRFGEFRLAKSITLRLVAVDLATGAQEMEIDLVRLDQPDPIHTINSYASPTPVIDGDNIYCHFGTFGTICVDRKKGAEVWRKRLPLEHGVGPGSSPFVYKNALVLICDGMDQQYVTALDKSTGETLWRTDRPPLDAASGEQKKSYDTPIAIIDAAGREQLICMGSQWLVAYNPTDGSEIWKVRHGKGFSVVPRPVYGDGTVYISTGFGKPQLWAIRVDGSGDVTDTHVAWVEKKGIPAKPSPLLIDGELYVISDDGIASCFDAASGELVWKQRVGGKYSASPLMAAGKIYLCSHEGKVSVLKPGREYQLLAENQLDGQLMASPAALGDSLLIRSDTALYRIAE